MQVANDISQKSTAAVFTDDLALFAFTPEQAEYALPHLEKVAGFICINMISDKTEDL